MTVYISCYLPVQLRDINSIKMCTYVHQKTQTYKVHRQNESNPIYIKNRIDNVWYVYIMEYYNAVKKKELMLNATTWMNLMDIVSHKSQT